MSVKNKGGVAAIIVLLVVLLVGGAVLNFTSSSSNTRTAADNLEIDNGDTKIDWSRYETFDVALSGSYEITKSGVYNLTGEISDGLITVNASKEDKVKLILNGVTIKNSAGPAIYVVAADDTVIELAEGTENILEDGSSYANYDEDVKGVIFSKDDLSFTGTGKLIVTANYQDGIVSKDDLKFNSGTYVVTAKDDGIRGKDSVYIVDGDFTISAGNKGIRSTNEERTGKGFVLVAGGKIDITKSYEGIEAPIIKIAGGETNIVASDDGMNAGNTLLFDGGKNIIDAAGDGVDSNGAIYISGGETIIYGPTSNGDGALDSETGILQTGGKLIALGSTGMAESMDEKSTTYSISAYLTTSVSAGGVLAIKDASGNAIWEVTAKKTFSHIAAGSEDLKLGETYYIYVDDVQQEEFTIEDVVTTIGSGGLTNAGGMMGGQGGNMMRGGDMEMPEDVEMPEDMEMPSGEKPDDMPEMPSGGKGGSRK